MSDTASKRELARRYYEVYHKTIGHKRMKKIIEILLETDLIIEEKDPDDKRQTIYSHPAEYTPKYTPRHVSNSLFSNMKKTSGRRK